MKYKIEDTVDKTGEPVSLWHSDCFVQNKELYTIYEKSVAFMMEKGWAMNPSGLIKSDHKVIFAENKDGKPMGGVVYEYHPWNRQGWIVLIFTADEFRGRHIYSLLQKALEDETIKLGGTSIASLAHKDNEPRIKAGAREGMHPQYLRLYKDLSGELEKRKAYMQIKMQKEWKDINKERWRG